MISLPTVEGGFGCVVADPPWRYTNTSTRAAAEDHYPTMSNWEIAALPVEDVVAKNAHLYLWVTAAHLPEVFKTDLFSAWGFRYVQPLVWAKAKGGKLQMGLGNYFRHATEICLFGVRGKAKVLRHDVVDILFAERAEHSRKPVMFYEVMEAMSPGPRLELFARGGRPGWDSWGHEAQGSTGSEAA